MKYLVTGGSGFIGSHLIKIILKDNKNSVINIDKLTYSGKLENLENIKKNDRYQFHKIDVCDEKKIYDLLIKYNPDYIFHLAAESHVDRSISSPYIFMMSNIMGTYHMLEATRKYLIESKNNHKDFKFIYISTDEVYGALKLNDPLFRENSNYLPNSPYSASKASGNHLVRAYFQTFNTPTITTMCSNNYGPFQYPEKLIPVIIKKAIKGKEIPIYGTGSQIRDWIYVEDHVRALCKVATKGVPGNNYNIGTENEITNIDLANIICDILDKKLDKSKILPNSKLKNFRELITFVKDRPGHDFRYAINSEKITKEIGWSPRVLFIDGIEKTINWYLNNKEYLKN